MLRAYLLYTEKNVGIKLYTKGTRNLYFEGTTIDILNKEDQYLTCGRTE